MAVIDLRNDPNSVSNTASASIVKIINAMADAQKSQTDLKKEVLLHQVQQKMDLQQKQAEFQQDMSNIPQIQSANNKLNGIEEPTAMTDNGLGTSGVADSGTPKAVTSPMGDMVNGAIPPMSMANPTQQPINDIASKGFGVPSPQPQAQPQPIPQIPQGVKIPSPTGMPLPPPKGNISIGSDGKPVYNQLEPKDKNYAGLYRKWRSGQPLSLGENKFVQEYLGMKDMANDPFGTLGIDTVNLSPDQIGEELKAKNPGMYAQLESIKDGKYSITGRGSDAMNKIATQVQTIWPGTDLQALKLRYDTRKDFTSGKTANNITALNTALSHLDKLSRNADTLDNGWFRQGNKLGNILKTQTGDSRVRVMNSDIHAVTGELANTFKQTGATDTEIKNFQDSLQSADSKQVVKDVANEFINLIGGRAQPLLERWQNSFGQDSTFPVLGRNGEKVLANHGYSWNPQTGEINKNDESSAAAGGQPTIFNAKTGKTMTLSADGKSWQ